MADYSVNQWDVLEVQIAQSHEAQRVLNVLHYQFTSATPITDGPAEVARVISLLATGDISLVHALQSCQSQDILLSYIRGQIVHPARRHFVQQSLSGPGLIAQPAMPPNVAMVLSKQTTGVGRGRTGRMSVGGVPRTFVTGGSLTAGAMNAMNALGSEVDNPLSAGGSATAWVPCVLPSGNFQEAPRVTSCFTQPTSRIIRRRTVGLGI